MADQINAKNEGSTRIPAPEGQFLAVCCDVIDLGMIENKQFGKMQHKCAIVFQLDEENPDTGKRWEVAERFTVSMHEKAQLRKFLGNWRGKPYNDAEADEGVPLHRLDGVPALVQIEHRESNGKWYANIGTIMKAPKGVTIKPDGYVRGPGWKKQDALPPAYDGDYPPPPEDDGYDPIPF